MPPPTNTLKNTPTNGTTLTEQLLNTRRRYQTCERTRKITITTQDDRKTKKRKPDWTCTPGGSLKQAGKFPHSENLPHWQVDQLGQKRNFRGSERATHHLCQAEQTETYSDAHATAVRAPAASWGGFPC